MITVSIAEDLLRNLHAASVDEEVAAGFVVTFRSIEFWLSKEDIDDYLSIRDTVVVSPETAIFLPGYYEHAVEVLSPGPVPGAFRLMRGSQESIELKSQDEQIKIELSRISIRHLLTLLDKVDPRRLREILYRGSPTRLVADRHPDSTDRPELLEAFRRILTVKVVATSEYRSRSKTSALRSIAEAGLFNISYSRRVGLVLSQSWERKPHRLGIRRGEEIQFPRRIYKPDLVAHFQLALSSDSLVLTYLSLYKILEYFFVSTAETVLHRRLTEQLAMPSFSHRRRAHLRQLASTVRRFDQRTDEQRMLAQVIEHFFMPDEIATWIAEYESENDAYYTVPQTVFGLSHTVDLNPDKVASSLAKRIYHIRNALVHHKEGDLPRFVPFTGHEDVLVKELPIVMFLAERLIVKTGDDL